MRFVFGEQVLDVGRRELRRGGETIAMEPQVFDLLVHLVRHRERVVTKDELVAEVWQGRIVSDSALTTRINAARRAVGDSGETQTVIRTLPRKGFRFVAAVDEATAPPPTPDVAAAPVDRPSIAVLPFANMSDDPGQDYFTDGIAEDITTALSKWRQFFVIARNSAFTYKGRAVSIPQVARELGVRYVLEGSVRKAGDRLRITAQLIDAPSGAHIWSERYDGAAEDVFDLQDRITASIVGTIEPRLHAAELERVRQKRPESLAAYDYYLQALPHLYANTREANDEALRLLSRAIERDAGYALAYATAANCYHLRQSQGWGESIDDTEAHGIRLAEAALARAHDDPAVLWMAGWAISSMAPDAARGHALIERSLALNPNCAQAWGAKGWTHCNMMQGSEALAAFERAIRLSPFDPWIHSFYGGLALGHIVLETYEQAVEQARRSVQVGPRASSSWRILCIALALAGRDAEAREAMRRLLTLNPSLTLAKVTRERLRQLDERLRQRTLDGLRRAGMPEG